MAKARTKIFGDSKAEQRLAQEARRWGGIGAHQMAHVCLDRAGEVRRERLQRAGKPRVGAVAPYSYGRSARVGDAP